MRVLMTMGLLVLLLGGCGPAADCKDVCFALMAECDWAAWNSVEQCARGCDDELFRHPERAAVYECYDEAAYLCDIDRLLQCRVMRDELVGVEVEEPED